jgi:UDP-N-acetylmuramoylalanine--D-glutamate ligase
MPIESLQQDPLFLRLSTTKQHFLESLAGSKLWVAGAGKSGVAAALLAQKCGAQVFATEAGAVGSETKNTLAKAGILFEEGGHSLQNLSKHCDCLVLSPGIPLSKPLPLQARKLNIPILSEIELAGLFVPENKTLVGITGTNGKSSVTNYLAQIFERAGKRSVACGNIGLPFAFALQDPKDFEVFVLEMSSYQCESTHSLRFDATVLLNLQNDHLQRYEVLPEYLKAKWRLALLTKETGICVVEKKMLELALQLGLALPRSRILVLETGSSPGLPQQEIPTPPWSTLIHHESSLPIALYGELLDLGYGHLLCAPPFSRAGYEKKEKGCFQAFVQNNKQLHTFEIEHPCIPGEHNIQNLLAANAAALGLGVSPSLLALQWNKETSTYRQLPHRLENVTTDEGTFLSPKGVPKKVTLINDSKATNVESTLVALKSYETPLLLLAGGEPKGDSYLSFVPFLGNPIFKVYPFGKAGPLIEETLLSYASSTFVAPISASLKEAAEKALEDARAGDTILLSPACASFDEFRNFEHRGDTFKEWALSCFQKEKA